MESISLVLFKLVVIWFYAIVSEGNFITTGAVADTKVRAVSVQYPTFTTRWGKDAFHEIVYQRQRYHISIAPLTTSGDPDTFTVYMEIIEPPLSRSTVIVKVNSIPLACQFNAQSRVLPQHVQHQYSIQKCSLGAGQDLVFVTQTM
jgi:hypothetical protein